MQGRTLLHYHFLEKLGEGGMGLVYKARDETLGRLVAIKVLPDSRLDPSSRSRFFLEARTASALNHPNIITIHEIASCEGTEMIVMEYVEGHTLGALLRSGPLPLSDVFKYAIQIAERARKSARGRHHPSRYQARQHHGDRRWPGQSRGLRAREGPTRQPSTPRPMHPRSN